MKELDEYKKKFAILVVDDNEDNVYTLVHRLKREGYYNIHTAFDGVAALDLLQEEAIDLILLDIMMPKMNGIEVLTKLKDDINRGRIMVLMISAAESMENIIKCIKLGAIDFLPKPFNVDLLRTRIGACLEKKWHLNQESIYLEQIELEKRRYKKLLNSIFPEAIVGELTKTQHVQPRSFKDVAILFVDIVKFTHYSETHKAQVVFDNLQEFVELCETLALKHSLEKIKTLGDAFMVTANMFKGNKKPVESCINFTKEVMQEVHKLPTKWDIRAGIDYGNVIGGVVGHRQYMFDIWGDAVNCAARIQDIAEPNTICLSRNAFETLKDQSIATSRGEIIIKGKGPIEIFKCT